MIRLSMPSWRGNETLDDPFQYPGLAGSASKVDVDSKDDYGQTPLSRAAENGHEAVAKLLLETGKVDVDSKHKYGRTPLSWAAEKGHEAVAKLLLETMECE